MSYSAVGIFGFGALTLQGNPAGPGQECPPVTTRCLSLAPRGVLKVGTGCTGEMFDESIGACVCPPGTTPSGFRGECLQPGHTFAPTPLTAAERAAAIAAAEAAAARARARDAAAIAAAEAAAARPPAAARAPAPGAPAPGAPAASVPAASVPAASVPAASVSAASVPAPGAAVEPTEKAGLSTGAKVAIVGGVLAFGALVGLAATW